MKKMILLVLLSALAGGSLVCPFTLWFFEHRTGHPVTEILDTQDKCAFLNYDHCNMIYYFVPDEMLGTPEPAELEEPDKTEL